MEERLNLVTGATGFSASYVIRDLLERGEQVVATDLPSALGDQKRLQVLEQIGLNLDHPNLEIIPANLLDPGSLPALFERPVTHIFHTASLYDYSVSLDILRRVNVEGTRNLLEAIEAADLDLERFIHWSTCGVFGKPYTAADGEKINIPFDEESSSPKTAPLGRSGPEGTHLVNAYSVSKWEQEQLIWRTHREKGLPVTVIRPAPIYGPGSDYGHGGIIIAMAKGYVPAIPADAKNYITFSVHVEDLARFALFIAEHKEAIGEDYNVVDDSIISFHSFLHYIALLTGQKLHDIPLISNKMLRPIAMGAAWLWTWLDKNLGVPRVRVFEIQSTTYIASSYWISNRKSQATGFTYNYADVREGLKDTVAWFKKMGWLTK